MTLAYPTSAIADPGEEITSGAPAPPGRKGGQRRRHDSPKRRLLTLEHVLIVAAGLAVVVSVVLRFVTHSSLWLDEALTVNIARLPLHRLFDALRQDGSPPAYYVMLHYWIRLFGSSDVAVRVLPGMLSVATIPATYLLGRALGGRRAGMVAAVFLATSPFAVRYGSENRMYSLVMLLVTLGGLAVVVSLRDPTPKRLIAVGVCGGLLMLTHYWAFYLLGGVAIVLLVASLSGTNKTASRFTLAALGVGSLLFAPWVPSFIYQALHTGTPWEAAPSPFMLVEAVGQFARWDTPLGIVLFVLYCALFGCLFILATASMLPAGRRVAVSVGLRSQVPAERWAVPLVAVAWGTLILALGGGMLSGAAFAYRYASVVLPAVVMLAALGATALGHTYGGRTLQAAVVAVVALVGVPVAASWSTANRTEASVIADRISSVVRPGDVVAYCPDQLGPAASRLLRPRYVQVTFPRFDPPKLINWVDYAKVNAAAPLPGVFARELVNLAGGTHSVWLVWEPGYRTLGRNCEQLRDSLVALRPNFSQPVTSHPDRYYEHESLDRFAPG